MKVRILLVAASVGLLAGCPSDDDNDVVKSYRYTVNVSNLTANQPTLELPVLVGARISASGYQCGEC